MVGNEKKDQLVGQENPERSDEGIDAGNFQGDMITQQRLPTARDKGSFDYTGKKKIVLGRE